MTDQTETGLKTVFKLNKCTGVSILIYHKTWIYILTHPLYCYEISIMESK